MLSWHAMTAAAHHKNPQQSRHETIKEAAAVLHVHAIINQTVPSEAASCLCHLQIRGSSIDLSHQAQWNGRTPAGGYKACSGLLVGEPRP